MVDDYVLNEVIDWIKRLIDIEEFDDAKILIIQRYIARRYYFKRCCCINDICF